MKRKIIVIGGVAAGPSAATKAKRVSPDAEVVLYEQGEHISYGVCEIPFFISGEIQDSEKLVVYTSERLKKEKDVTAHILHRVESILPSKREISIRNIKDGKTFTDWYDKLIIATGSSSKHLGIHGEKCRNVFYIKSLSNAYALKKYIDEEKPRNAVIIGAGFIGLEMADALSKRELEISIVHKSEHPLSILEVQNRKIISEELKTNAINFIPNSTVEWFGIGSKQNVVAVGLKNQTLETDMVIVAIGVSPNSHLAQQSGIQVGNQGGILVSDRMNALGVNNIFAAGDCCEFKNIVTKKSAYVSLATTASKTGRIAGENAAGGNVQFKGFVRAMGMQLFDLEIAHVGLSSKEAQEAHFQIEITDVKAKSKIGMFPNSTDIYFTLISDKTNGKLLGANVLGKNGAVQRANVFALAIRHGLTVQDIAELDLIYAPKFSPLWDGIIQTGIQARK
jgi:NADPH-dependent 2,4-dienoyl-CoA reductase/sulfur reductase-like enzyme